MNPPGLSLLTLNIGNPSPERAQRQLAWLARRDEHILVLTETKASAGCQLLVGAFTAAGYHVTYPEPGPGEYGTMIISRVAAASDGFGDQIGYLPTRAAAVILPAPSRPLRVIGLYVPSRDASAEKTERNRFARIVDAGLGAGPVEYLDMVLHSFPAPEDPATAFAGQPPPTRPLPQAQDRPSVNRQVIGSSLIAGATGISVVSPLT